VFAKSKTKTSQTQTPSFVVGQCATLGITFVYCSALSAERGPLRELAAKKRGQLSSRASQKEGLSAKGNGRLRKKVHRGV